MREKLIMDTVIYDLMFDIEETHWWWRSRRAIAKTVLDRLMPGPEPKRVLDVGCGMGAWLRELPGRFEGYGVDLSAQAVEGCKERGVQRVFLGDGASLPFESGFFHAVTAFDVLEHLEDEGLFLKNIRQVLQASGWLLVTVPALPKLTTHWDELNQHKRRYTRRQLIQVLEQNRFQVQFCSYFNFFLFPLAVFRLIYESLRACDKHDCRLSPGAHPPPALANRIFQEIFSSERKWLSHERSFPWGSSLIAWARKMPEP